MAYVVTGATGQVGSAAVDYLVSKSVPVRVVIRSPNKAESFTSRHIEVAIADSADAEALARAFQGARAVFAMNPPSYDTPDMMVDAMNVSNALAWAIQVARVPRVVVLSSVGAERNSRTGSIRTTHILEEALKNIAPEVVVVRNAWFMENWLKAASAVKSGHAPVLGSMLQKLDRKIPQIASQDIGHTVAEYMIKPSAEVGRSLYIQLEGPEPYSPNDIAEITGQILGKPVKAAAMTEEQMWGLFNKAGFSQTTGQYWIEMARGFDDDTISWTNDGQAIRVRGTVTMADVLKKGLK